MTEPNPPMPPTPPPADHPPTKKKRRWPTVLLALVVLVALLVVLLPTLLSSSPARSFVVGKLQSVVPNGRLEIAHWSFGWFSPIRLGGVKILDEKGEPIVEADEVKTDLTLLKAVRQNFDLGDTVVDAAGHLVVYADGSTNLQRALAAKPTPHAEPERHKAPPATAPKGEASALPNVTGTITLKLHGDVVMLDAGQATRATARLRPGSGGTITITDINRPVDADLTFLYDTGESTRQGTIALKASADAVENNRLDLAGLSGSMNLSLKDVDAAGLRPLLAMAGRDDLAVAGMAAGMIAGEFKPGQSGGLTGSIDVSDFQLTTPQLPRPYRAKTIELPIELARDVHGDASHVRLDIGLKTPQGAAASADAFELPSLRLTIDADLPADPAAKRIDQATLRLVASDSGPQPLVTLDAKAASLDLADSRVGSATLTRCGVPSFQRLQRTIDPFVPALRAMKIELAGGALDATADAADIDWSQSALSLKSLHAVLPGVVVRRDGKDLFKDSLDVTLAATSKPTGQGLAVDVSQLSVASALATAKKGDGPLNFVWQPDAPRGAGVVDVTLDAVQANGLARAMSPDAKVPQVTGGRFAGKLTLASTPEKGATAGFAGTLEKLTLADTPVQDESMTIDVSALAPPKAAPLEAGVRVRGSFFNVVGKQIRILMPAAGVPAWKMVQTADLDLGVKDLARATTIATAFVPGLSLPVKPDGGLAVTTKVRDGHADVDLTAGKLVVTNPAGKSFAFDSAKPVTLKLAANVEGDKAVTGLRVTELAGDLDVATVKLAEPIVVGLSGPVTASGKVTLDGSLDRVLTLLAVVQSADKPMPYGGRFGFTQAVGPKGNSINLAGRGTVDDFVVFDDAGKPSVQEKQVSIVDDVSVDTARQIASITSLSLDMASSKAAHVDVTGGVEKWSDARLLKDVIVKVDADGPKVWPIVFGLLPPAQQTQFKDAKLDGPIRIDLTANGAYPARPTWNESAKSLVAYGGVSVAGLDTMGLSVRDFVLPISLVKGQLVTGDLRKKKAERFAKPFTVNDGQGDFGSIVLDVGDPGLRLSIGRRQKLLQKVKLNPVLATQLGSLASVIFTDAQAASGLLDLTVVECSGVPLLDLMNKQATASFLYSVHDLKLDGPVPSALSQALQWGDKGILGDIDAATLDLKKGVAYQDMTIALQRETKVRQATGDKAVETKTETLKFKGGVDLASSKFKDYALTIAPGLLLKDWRKAFPDGATVALKGKATDVTGILAQAVSQLAVQGYGGDAIDKVLGGLKKEKKER